jgi:drug/metabolite transporter (DMT)-like permease
VTTLALVSGTVVNLALDGPSTWSAAQALPLRGWVEMAYLAVICTALGYGVWFAAMRTVPVNVVVMTVFTQPFAGTLIAVLLLGEALQLGQLWGGLAIAVGLALGLRQRQPPRVVEEPACHRTP